MSKCEPCPGCGAVLRDEEGPTHPYMASSPECWRLYGEVLAREYADAELMEVHFLSVDAFAVQHPGDPSDRRARQSVWIHLAGLKAVLRDEQSKEFRYDLLRRLADRDDFPEQPPHVPFEMTASDIAQLGENEEHVAGVRRWAQAALEAYEAADDGLHEKLAALQG